MLKFTTEAERQKAREQFCHTANAIWSGDAQEMPNFYAEQFDSRFPPIAPPKMVPFYAWAVMKNNATIPYHVTLEAVSPAPFEDERVARVRVVEVDDE